MKRIVSYLFTMLLVFGCEYELHDNYIELNRSTPDMDINIYLNVENEGKVYLTEYGSIQFSLEALGDKIQSCVFRLGSQEWRFTSPVGEFWYSRLHYQGGNPPLICDIYIENDTPSIAEQLGENTPYRTYEWPVEYIAEPTPSLTHKVNDEGFLELSWKRQPIAEANFSCYKVYYNYNECAVITDINKLSYVYEPYCGGYGDFYVITEYKDGRQWNLGHINMNNQSVKINVDYSLEDSITLSWDNPYNSAVNITVGGNILASFVKEKSVRIVRRQFGASMDGVGFSFFPQNENHRDTYSSFSVWETIYLGKGINLANGGYWVSVGYNLFDDMLYVSSYNEVTNWSLPTIEKYSDYSGVDQGSTNRYALSMYDSKMAAQHSGSIELFEGKDLKSVKTIPCYPFQYFAGSMTFTKDGKFICFAYDNAPKGLVYDAATGAHEYTWDFPQSYWDIDNLQISSDARYIVVPAGGVLNVMTIDDYKIANVAELNVGYNFWCLNPVKPNELFVSYGYDIYIYDCRDLSLIGALNYPGMSLGNIDPKTGYLLLYSDSSIQIVNPQTKQTLYTAPVSNPWGIKLLGNTIITNTGSALNLNKYLKK